MYENIFKKSILTVKHIPFLKINAGDLLSRCTVKANAQHPQWLQDQLTQETSLN